MKRLLKRLICLFRGHKYQFESDYNIHLTNRHDEEYFRVEIYICTRCGKIKGEEL